MSSLTNISANSPIGVFDSGTGGITVLKEIARALPNEKVIYVGDDAHFPYGEKSVEQLREYATKIAGWLMSQGVKIIVIACNTATAAALELLQKHCSVPVIGVVHAGVRSALESTKNNNIGILATRASIELGVYEKNILNENPSINVVSVAAPKFVDFVENDLDMVRYNPSSQLINCVDEYIEDFVDNNCDTIVMGCTHFPPLIPVLQQRMGENVNFVSPSQKTAEELKVILDKNNLLSSEKPSYKFFSSGNDAFRMKKFWGDNGTFEHLCL